MQLDIDDTVMRFSLASRELFNNFFHVKSGYENDGWSGEERFSAVQEVLFQKLVIEPAGLPSTAYGEPCDSLLVELRHQGRTPIMINREIRSGYWDYPVTEISGDCRMVFVEFFDWDQLAYKDHRYVHVRIDRCPEYPGVEGKHALIEKHYVRFARA